MNLDCQAKLLLFSWLLLLATAPSLYGQEQQAYFQQRVSYTIDATLDPSTHSLSVSGSFSYVNNSPDLLDSLPVHLWANAFSNRTSAYAQQKRRFGDVAFLYAPENDLGGYRDLAFTGKRIATSTRLESEVANIQFNEPLLPGDSTRVAFSYTLQIPRAFSRLGRTGDLYQLTQWFPKPAVYDRDGWHTMPYLDFGEFYYEYGDYDVTLRVPENGMVGATGQLINPKGISARQQRIDQTTAAKTAALDAQKYGDRTSVYVYSARHVHDFAWFVSPRFRVSVDTARLSAQRAIPSYAYYSAGEANLWKEAPKFLARAAEFADSLIGEYPHPQISAVAAPLGVGGGMEYPMITVIGATGSAKALDEVLAHEAFHNWFQGMLGSNERAHPWMDEGLTSWLEKYYRDTHYPRGGPLGGAPDFLVSGAPKTVGNLLHRSLATTRRHPRPDMHIDSLSMVGYGYAAYTQPELLFHMLESFQGQDSFRQNLQDYFTAWKFKHPQPSDLQASLGGASVNWLFDDLLLDNSLPDYRIEGVELEGNQIAIRLTNLSEVASPFPIAFELNDGTYSTAQWQTGFVGQKVITLPVPGEARRVAIDAGGQTPEIAYGDNFYRLTPGPAPSIEPLAVRLFSGLTRLDRNTIGITPTIGYNAADRLMLGIGFHNYTVPPGPSRFYVLPMVSTRDAGLNGLAGLNHSWYSADDWWREVELSLRARQYHYHYNDTYDYNDRFRRATVEANVLLSAKAGLPLDQRFSIRAHGIGQRYAVGLDAAARQFREQTKSYVVAEVDYTLQRNDPILGYGLRVGLQAAEGFARASTTFNTKLRYQAAPNFVRLRAFAGAFIHRDAAPEIAAFLLPNGTSGFLDRQYDYTFEEFIVDRSEATNSNQVFVRDGSLTLPFLLSSPFSDSWLVSLSAQIDAPVNLPLVGIRGYVDAALYPDSRTDDIRVPLTGGVRLAVADDLFQLSFPLFNSSFVRESLVFTSIDARYRERIAFSLNLAKLNLDELLRGLRK